MSDRQNPEKELHTNVEWSQLLSTDWSPEPRNFPLDIGIYEGFIVDNLLNSDECNRIIEASEKLGYGFIKDQEPEKRGNLRLQIEDSNLAGIIYQRLHNYLPKTVELYGEVRCIKRLNERFRLSKYYEGTQFENHCDNCLWVSENEQSFYTVNIYLNDNFIGGRTRFFEKGGKGQQVLLEVKPRKGRVLSFRQPPTQRYWHDGEIVSSGIKYLLRTDVIYSL
jgi:hypothetical protein